MPSQVSLHLIANGNPTGLCFKNGKSKETLSKVALYLLRFNVALQIAVLAIIVNLGLAICTFYFGLNALYCAFGMDCVIGVITSAILVWRFAASKQDNVIRPSTEQIYLLNSIDKSLTDGSLMSARLVHQQQNKLIHVSSKCDFLDSTIEPDNPEDHVRELWSTFWLGQVMIISGIGVCIRTIVEIVATQVETSYQLDRIDYGFDPLPTDRMLPMEPLFDLALISLSLNLVLMCFKIFIYYYLGSNSMLIEGINSAISSIFASMTIISIRYADSVHYLDQIVSILFGIFLIIYGAYNVLHTVGKTVYKFTKNTRSQYEMLV